MNLIKKISAHLPLVFLISFLVGITYLMSSFNTKPAHNPYTEENSSKSPQKLLQNPKPIVKPTLLNSVVYHESIFGETSNLRSNEKQQYTNALKLAKAKFPRVPTTLIFTTSITESDLDPRAKHPNHSDHGMCGINFKYNGQDLIDAGIIKCEADLNKIGPNIMACAFLYDRFLSTTHGRVYNAIVLYKGTNSDGRCNKLYSLYRSVVYKVTVSHKS